jgi:hypothetical protein
MQVATLFDNFPDLLPVFGVRDLGTKLAAVEGSGTSGGWNDENDAVNMGERHIR